MRSLSSLLVLCLAATPALADLRVASAFSDHMVLQVGEPVHLWGWADAGAEVVVQFEGEGVVRTSVTTDESGAWTATLPPAQVGEDAFAAHRMTVVSGGEQVAFEDVLLGEVWLASGQSNMEMGLGRSNSWDEVRSAAPHRGLRMFTVQRASLADAPAEVQGMWSRAEMPALESFSAVALHFGLDLIEELDRPVGIVHSSWGGSSIEAWMSTEALLALPGDPGAFSPWEEARQTERRNGTAYSAQELAPGDAEGWQDCTLPVDFEQLVPNYNGSIWFRRTVALPSDWLVPGALDQVSLSLGAIDDMDEVWLDGKRLGATTDHLAPRVYRLTPDAVAAFADGTAQLAVRVTDTGGWGGFSGAAAEIALVGPGGMRLSLTDGWQWKRGATIINSPANRSPAHLYNAMIAPLAGLTFAGCIWYQGESNARYPKAYAQLFPAMIRDWRARLAIPELPFYWVQLTSYEAKPAQDWPGLREAQRSTLSEVRSGGMAVIIDVGNRTDIHPRDKRTVGGRLARWALFDTYGRPAREVAPSGPNPLSATREDATAIVTFETFGYPLQIRNQGQALLSFELGGSDGVWHQAEATIDANTVRVTSDLVPAPTGVRYAWSNVPRRANLSSTAGLPASPFRFEL